MNSPSSSKVTKSNKSNNINSISTNLLSLTLNTTNCTPIINTKSSDDSIWKPPLLLQQKQINPLNGYLLYFPLELTHKDYLNKIFDLIIVGIQIKVFSILKENDIITNQDKYYDICYILHLLLDHKDVFINSLSIISIDNYQQSIIFLLKMKESYLYMKDEFDYHDFIKSTFDHSIFLLDCFGKYSKVAYDSLIILANQYKSHQNFKQQRIQELGWNNHDINNKESLLLEIFDQTESTLTTTSTLEDIVSIIKDNLSNEHMGTIKLICRLTSYSIDLNIYIQYLLKFTNPDFHEMKRLKMIDNDIQAMIDCVISHPIYGNGRTRILYLQNQIYLIKKYMKELVHNNIMKNNQKEMLELQELISVIEALINYFPSGILLDNMKLIKNKNKINYNYLLLDTFKLESMLYLLKISNNYEVMQYVCNTWYNINTISKEPTEDIDLFSVSFLKQLGLNSIDMHNANYTALELKNGGYDLCNEMKIAGYTASELKAVGFTVSELKQAGFSTYDLKYAGFSHNDVQSSRKTIQQLRLSGHSIQSLYQLGYRAKDLKDAGYTATLLKSGGYTLKEIKECGFNYTALKAAGYTMDEIKKS